MPAPSSVELDSGAEGGLAKALGGAAVECVAVRSAVAEPLHQRLVRPDDVALAVVEELLDLWSDAGAEQPGDPRDAVDGPLEDHGLAGGAGSADAVEVHRSLTARTGKRAPGVDGDRAGRRRVRGAGIEGDNPGGVVRRSAPGAKPRSGCRLGARGGDPHQAHNERDPYRRQDAGL